MDIEILKNHAKNIRKKIVQMVFDAQSGHPGGSLGATELLTYLYFEEMDIDANNIATLNRDRFVLSKGHTSPALYATLDEKGLLNEDLKTFRQINSKLQGHPNMNYVAGVDMSTGSLGQGLSCAVGMALANKLDQNGHRIFALVGDGESEEGLIWEAMMAASHYHLDNLCVIFDVNHLQIDGRVEDVMNPLPLDEKAKAFGFEVLTCDGNDFISIDQAFKQMHKISDKPVAIIANTTKGKGVSYMENNAAWHGSAPKQADYEIAMSDLEKED